MRHSVNAGLGQLPVPVKSMHPCSKARYGTHADFLNERFNVDMIHGICARRLCADLPNVASSRSVNSMSFSDIPADLNDRA